jgi:trans-aconitate methyltransferase
MQVYKWDAKDYEKQSKSQQLWAQELFGKLNLKGDESVLDIGCGDGKVTKEIASILTSGEIVGIDSSSEMIALAKHRFPNNKYKNIQFHVGDASKLAFEEEFNIVFSNATLHWIQDHRPVLKGIFNSLKKGGIALLQMGGKGNAEAILAVLERLLKTKMWCEYFRGFNFSYAFYSPNEYKKWICQIGFNERRIELIPKDMIHQSRGDLEGWIRTTWLPYTQRIPEDNRSIFIEQIIDTYLIESPPDEFGNIHVKMSRLEVEIEKPQS